MKEMKKEIKMPGFTAEASVYKSSGCYYMVGGHGSNTRPVVGPAKIDPAFVFIGEGPGLWGNQNAFLKCVHDCGNQCFPFDILCWKLCGLNCSGV